MFLRGTFYNPVFTCFLLLRLRAMPIIITITIKCDCTKCIQVRSIKICLSENCGIRHVFIWWPDISCNDGYRQFLSKHPWINQLNWCVAPSIVHLSQPGETVAYSIESSILILIIHEWTLSIGMSNCVYISVHQQFSCAISSNIRMKTVDNTCIPTYRPWSPHIRSQKLNCKEH